MVQTTWNEDSLWAVAWRHAWTRNAVKQEKWMRDTSRHYTAKQKDLWVRARRDVIEGIKKCTRAEAIQDLEGKLREHRKTGEGTRQSSL